MSTYDIFPTMITPYNSDGTVDYKTAERYVEWYYKKGCNGVFAICQSSEIFFLSLEERIKLNTEESKKIKRGESLNIE